MAKCKNCGEEIRNNDRTVFCSSKCHRRYYNSEKVLEYRKHPKGWRLKNCLICGNPVPKTSKKYCSKYCCNEALTRKHREQRVLKGRRKIFKADPITNGYHPVFICDKCGKISKPNYPLEKFERRIFTNGLRLVDVTLHLCKEELGNKWHYVEGKPIEGKKNATNQYKLRCHVLKNRGYFEVSDEFNKEINDFGIENLKFGKQIDNQYIRYEDVKCFRGYYWARKIIIEDLKTSVVKKEVFQGKEIILATWECPFEEILILETNSLIDNWLWELHVKEKTI